MNEVEVYRKEWLRLQALGHECEVTLNFASLHAIICALQVSLTCPTFAKSQREIITEIGKTLSAYIEVNSPALAAIMAKGWEPGQKLKGIILGSGGEPPCSEPFSKN